MVLTCALHNKYTCMGTRLGTRMGIRVGIRLSGIQRKTCSQQIGSNNVRDPRCQCESFGSLVTANAPQLSSVRPSVRTFIHPSVRPSIRPSVSLSLVSGLDSTTYRQTLGRARPMHIMTNDDYDDAYAINSYCKGHFQPTAKPQCAVVKCIPTMPTAKKKKVKFKRK